MTGSPQPEAAASPRSAGLLLIALLALVALSPPEVHGVAYAGVAALVLLAVAIAPLVPKDAFVVAGGAVLAALAARFADAPGEAVEPAALPVVAVALGLAAARLRVGPAFAGGASVVLAGLLGSRAILEVAFLHDVAAEAVRSGPTIADAEAVLNRLEQGRAYGGFSTPAALAGFLTLLLPPALAWAVARRGAVRYAAIAACALGASGVLATRSLTAIAALGIAVGLAALRRRVGGRALAIALGVLALVGFGVALARPDGVFSFARQDSPWRLRAGNVRVALEIAEANPAKGVGPGGYAEAFPAFRRPGDNESRFAHDLPAQLAAEWGIPAGLALGFAFFALFLGPLLRRDLGWRDPAGAIALGLAAFAVHNLVDFTAFLPSFAFAAAALRGAIASRVEASSLPAPRLALGAVVAAAVLVCALSGGSRDALLDTRDAAAAGDRPQASARAARAAALAPWDADSRLAAAQALDPADPAAIAHADAAVAASPVRAAARGVRAEIRIRLGDLPGGYADLVRAATLNPSREAYARRRDEVDAALAGARR